MNAVAEVATQALYRITTALRWRGEDHAMAVIFDPNGHPVEVAFRQPVSADDLGAALAEAAVLVTGYLRIGMAPAQIGRAFVTNRVAAGPVAALVAVLVREEAGNRAAITRELAGDRP